LVFRWFFVRSVIPAKAGIKLSAQVVAAQVVDAQSWTLACAWVTDVEGVGLMSSGSAWL
jgi:hypothetical protein